MPRRPRPGVTMIHKAVPRATGKPTPEHEAHRAAMAEGGDPAMTTIPIDVALLRGRLSREQHAAAKKYRSLYRAAGGRHPHPSAVDLNGDRNGPGPVDPDAEERIHDEFVGARGAVRKQCGLGSLELMEAMVILDHWPSWCWASIKAPLSGSQVRAMGVAHKAFDALEGYFSTLYGHSSGKVRHTSPARQAIPRYDCDGIVT